MCKAIGISGKMSELLLLFRPFQSQDTTNSFWSSVCLDVRILISLFYDHFRKF